MGDEHCNGVRTSWILAYTKPHAESWAEANIRNQGFATLCPRLASRAGFPPLFPRYVFVGHDADDFPTAIQHSYGVQYVVFCGVKPARVSDEVIGEIRSRMDERGLVHLSHLEAPNPLFARRERERVRALVQLAAAGFRIKSA